MVSGGGYVGAWLVRWINDADNKVADVEKALGGDPSSPVPPELSRIEALRKNSNFLTPQVGIASVDTWTAIVLWVRNVLLNWLVFFPPLLLVAGIPNIYDALLHAMEAAGPSSPWMLLLLAAVVLLGFGTWAACYYLAGHNTNKLGASGVRWMIAAPVLLWAFLLPPALASGIEQLQFLIFLAAWGGQSFGFLIAWIFSRPSDRTLFKRNAFTWFWVSGLAAGILYLGILLIPMCSDERSFQLLVLATFGPLWITISHLLLSALYVAFRRAGNTDDADREWLARVSAVAVFPALLWSVFAFVCLFPVFAERAALFPDVAKTPIGWGMAIITAVSGLISVGGGKSATSTLDVVATPEQRKKMFTFDRIVTLATLVFIVMLLIAFSWLERMLAGAITYRPEWLGLARQQCSRT